MKRLRAFVTIVMAATLLIVACSKWDLERIEFTRVITVGAI